MYLATACTTRRSWLSRTTRTKQRKWAKRFVIIACHIELWYCCKIGSGVKGDAGKPGNRGDPGDRGPRGLVGKMCLYSIHIRI